MQGWRYKTKKLWKVGPMIGIPILNDNIIVCFSSEWSWKQNKYSTDYVQSSNIVDTDYDKNFEASCRTSLPSFVLVLNHFKAFSSTISHSSLCFRKFFLKNATARAVAHMSMSWIVTKTIEWSICGRTCKIGCYIIINIVFNISILFIFIT